MKFIVVSDIFEHPYAQNCITSHLSQLEHVAYLSLKTLCKTPDLTGDALHHNLFDQGGIETAAHALQAFGDPDKIALGYSAGGTALWCAAQSGMVLNGLYCVSSTRLRDLGAITPATHTYFGALDTHKPNKKWLKDIPDSHFIFENLGHIFYTETSALSRKACAKIANDIAKTIIRISI